MDDDTAAPDSDTACESTLVEATPAEVAVRTAGPLRDCWRRDLVASGTSRGTVQNRIPSLYLKGLKSVFYQGKDVVSIIAET